MRSPVPTALVPALHAAYVRVWATGLFATGLHPPAVWGAFPVALFSVSQRYGGGASARRVEPAGGEGPAEPSPLPCPSPLPPCVCGLRLSDGDSALARG